MPKLIDADALIKSLKESRIQAIRWHRDCVENSSDEMTTRAEQAIRTFSECILRVENQPIIEKPKWKGEGDDR